MIEKFICEKCDEEFDTKEVCLDHEKTCGLEHSFTCMKCGKTIKWVEDDGFAKCKINGCWDFNLGRAGFGSSFDGCDLHMQVCDDCLRGFVDSFTIEGREHIFNSGSNTYGSKEDWIEDEAENYFICHYKEKYNINVRIEECVYSPSENIVRIKTKGGAVCEASTLKSWEAQ